ncbi:MAG: fluoride efflux transporter CrcB [Bacteroidales bacterium]
MQWIKVLYLITGGAAGTLMRYFVSGLVHRYSGAGFPWGTLFVNVSGALIMGILWGIFEVRGYSSPVRIFLLIGLLGGYTTFSSFAIETLNLWREGEYWPAVAYVAMSNILGFAAVAGGFLLSRMIFIK